MPEPGKATLNVDPDMVAEVRLEVAKRLQRGQKTSMGALVREAWNAYLSAPVVPAGTSSTATQYSKGDPRVRELHQLGPGAASAAGRGGRESGTAGKLDAEPVPARTAGASAARQAALRRAGELQKRNRNPGKVSLLEVLTLK